MDKPKLKLPYGTGVYETIAIVGRKPAFLARHLERLERGAEWLAIPRARERVEQLILSKLGACPETPMAMRAEAPGHGIPGTSVWPRDRELTGGPYGLYWPKAGKARGPEDTIKHTQRAAKTTARNEARAAGCFDAAVLDAAGAAAEATVSNVFVLLDGTLVTPGDAQFPLPGVARGVVLEEASKLGLPVAFRGLVLEDFSRAMEAFVTNSIAQVLPIRFVVVHDGRRIELPATHPTADRLLGDYRAREAADLAAAPGPMVSGEG